MSAVPPPEPPRAISVVVVDESLTRPRLRETRLELAGPQQTLRLLIQAYLNRSNAAEDASALGLRLELALSAFASGNLVIFVNDMQVNGLDDEFFLRDGARVTFMRLSG